VDVKKSDKAYISHVNTLAPTAAKQIKVNIVVYLYLEVIIYTELFIRVTVNDRPHKNRFLPLGRK